MRLKTILVILMALMFLTTSLFTVAFSKSVLTKETKLTHEGESPQTTQATAEDSTLNQKELNKASDFNNAETKENPAKSWSPNIFPFDSFVEDFSTYETDMWRDFAKVDENSAELVIGVNNAQPDSYVRIWGLIVENGGKLVNTVSTKGEVIAVVADLPLNLVPSFVDDVQARNLTRYIEPNMKYQTQLEPNDPSWWQQWAPVKIEADYAWNTTIGDPSVLVAVIDTGIDYDHPDIAANYVPLGYDWVNYDSDPMDDNGHGTHVAGILAAVLNNGIGIAGLAQVSIMAEKGLDAGGWGYEVDLANALIHAVDQGADILSNSWGGYGESMLIYDAVKYAYDNGVLVVAAAGNGATSQKHYPAAYDEVIAVTATDRWDDPADFTNFGEWVEVAAPGVDVYSTYWDDTYTYMSGTSMSTPHVSGVAVLIRSQFPNMTRDQVRAQLRYTADDLGDPGFDDYYGHGRINARKAVEQAPPDHDLLIFDWEKPPYVKLGELATFNTTVLNFGISDETNVEVQLLVNSSLVDSTSIAFLPEGASTTVGLSWTPTVEGTYNVTSYVVPVPDETITENNLLTEIVIVVAPPPDTSWILLATDPDEGVGTSLKAIYGQLYSDIIYFKVEHHWSWTTINDIDTGIFIDADQDPSTGLPDGSYPGQNTGIGADYVIVVGWEATEMWKWDPIPGWWDIGNPISLAYLDAPDGSNVFIVGVYLAGVETAGALDCAAADVESDWDWMPDAGYFTWFLIQYEHELTVFIETPQRLQPGETSLLNATVYNRGLINETNVELQLLINGTTFNNVTIPELVNGTSHTIEYLWTPTAEATYNVTAYAPPVPDENVTANNVVSKLVRVSYLPRLLVVDTPWSEDTGALDMLGYEYTLVTPIEFATVDLYQYNVLFVGWIPGDTLVDALLARASEISDWVAAGNGIVALAEFDEVNRWAWLPLSVSGSSGFHADSVHILNPAHPVMSDLTDAELSGWGNSYHGYFISYDPAWEALAEGVEAAQPITLAATYGAGRIAITNQDPDFHLYYGNEEGAGKLLRNMIEWATPYIQYEHELIVSLDAPTRLEPGDSSLLNATVYNRGLSNETDVDLFLLINGTVVDNVTIPELVNGTSYTIDYLWTPMVEAMYNVTAYAPPVPDENVTANNIMSRMVYVRYVDVALISDGSELLAITDILDSMGIGYDIYHDNSMYLYTEDFSLLLDYPTVIFYQYNRLMTSGEHSALQSYLSSGGNLLVTGYDSLGSPSDPLLADVVRSSSTGDNTEEPDLYVVDPSHPIMNGPYGSFPAGYHISGLYSDNDAAEADTGRNAVTVAELADGYDKIIATGGLLGKVVYWNGIGPNDWTWNVDCEAMFKNTIAWFTIRYEHELTVSLDAPPFLEPGGSSLLNATVYNRGLSNETDVELFLLINGTMVNNVTITELVNGTFYTIDYLWTPTLEAIYNITAYAPPVPDENVTANNVATKMVDVRPVKGYVLFDQTHWTDSITYYSIWVANLTDRGYVVDTLTVGPITPSVLAGYDVFVIPQAHDYYSSDELSVIQDFVLDGGGLLVIGDDDPYIYTDLTSFAGITWTYGGVSGITYDITPHEVTQGVTSVYLDAPIAEILVAAPALNLLRDPAGGIMLAVSEQVGRVIGFADEGSLWNYGILQEDNLLLANNMIDWVKRKPPLKHIEDFLAKADEVLDEELSYVDTAPISESLRAEIRAKIWEIKALKHEALEELVMKSDDMIVDARGYVDRAEFEFRYIEEPEESAKLLAEAKELLALAEDEFSRGNYEPALRDALTAREKAITALRVAGFTLNAKSSKNIWIGFVTVEEAKLNDILWKLDEFNMFIDERVGEGDIPLEIGATLMEYNNEAKSWIEKAKDRLSVPLPPVLEGDLNVDGSVDSDDFFVFAGAYGSSIGDSAYNLDADLDWDGSVDSDDFFVFAGAYGNTV